MIKRARTARDFLDTFHSSTLEHRSKGEKLLLEVDFNETFEITYMKLILLERREISR